MTENESAGGDTRRYIRFRVYPGVAVARAKAVMIDLPHASNHRD
jgi:hypothetical protein